MIEEICVGFGVLVLLVIVLYFILFSKPFTYTKKKYQDRVALILVAKRNLAKVTVVASDITFERTRVRKDQSVEFDYPNSQKPAKLIVEIKPGRIKTFEV